MLSNFLRRCLKQAFGHSQKGRFAGRKIHSRPRSALLRLEALEDRVTPSTLTVNSSADSGVGSLRYEVGKASNGDTINFANSVGLIKLTSGEIQISKNLNIAGPGAGQLTVSGNNASRVFEITGSAKVTISGLTVANGFVSGNNESDFGFDYVGGGGILVDFGTQLTLSQDAVTGNHAQGVVGSDTLGGGLMNMGTANLVGCSFTYNEASGGGTPLDSVGGGGGGAVDNFGGPSGGASLTASNCTFANNITSCASDGVYFAVGGAFENDAGLAGSSGVVPFDPEPSTAVVSNCVFSDNAAIAGLTASGQGGAVYNTGEGTVLTLSNCTVNGNRAIGGDGGDAGVTTGYSQGQGGGLYNVGGSTLNVENCTVTNNQAIGGNNGIISNSMSGGAYAGEGIGGGILNNYGSILTVTNSTISGNVARGGDMTTQPGPGSFADGGGIANTAGFSTTGNNGPSAVAMTVTNCVISNNSAIGGHGNALVNTLMASGQLSGFGFGGGIDNSNGGSEATITNTQITRNNAIGGAGGAGNNGSQGLGGGIGVGFTMLLGSAANNGGTDGSQVTLINSTLSNNNALGGAAGAGTGTYGGPALGGGLAIEPTCSAGVKNSTIKDNVANGSQTSSGQANGGGGIENGGTLTLTNTTVNGNQAVTTVGNDTLGGGLLNNEGTATIVNSTFDGNEALGGGSDDFFGGSAGGAIDSYEGATLNVTGSQFNDNEAISAASAAGDYFYATGGAIEEDAGIINNNPSKATIANSSFTNNLVTGGFGVSGNGGGIDLQSNNSTTAGLVTMYLVGTSVTGNRSVGGGGGDGVTTGDSEAVGGGIESVKGTLTIANSTIANNEAVGGSGATISATDPFAGSGFGGGISNNDSGFVAGTGSVNGPPTDIGSLFITNSTISGNICRGGNTNAGPGGNALGGGMSNSPLGNLTMTDCNVVGNQALGGTGSVASVPGNGNTMGFAGSGTVFGGFAFGGGVDTSNSGSSATFIDCSITGNSAVGGAGSKAIVGGNGYGGGLGVGWGTLSGYVTDGSSVTLINSVVEGNVASGGQGGAARAAATGWAAAYTLAPLAAPRSPTAASNSILPSVAKKATGAAMARASAAAFTTTACSRMIS